MLINPIIYSIISILLITKFKSSWEIIISFLLIINLFLLITNPIREVPLLLSTNYISDIISSLLISLSLWISSLIIIARYFLNYKKSNSKLFIFITLFLSIILIISFSVNNTIYFYIIFESSIIPILLLIIFWGNQPERKKANLYIILYTITASLPLLILILKLLNTNFHILFLLSILPYPIIINQNLRWLIIIIAFIVKLPIFTLHLWLPKAHVEAPVAGSIVLAAILLKLGGYGHIRINKIITQPIFYLSYILIAIAIIGAIITNIICFRQTDLKALIAYSSVSHIGLIIVRTLSNSKLGQYGRILIILTHGLTSSCIFFLTNIIYQKTNRRNIILINGLPTHDPILSIIWILTISRNIAIPPRLNIIREITIIISSIFISKIITISILIRNFTTALYSLYIYSIINYNNQLKSINTSTNTRSINLITSISHIWPIFIISIIPTKLIIWC